MKVMMPPPSLPAAQHVGLSFATYVGTGVPDTMGAVGPTQFLSCSTMD